MSNNSIQPQNKNTGVPDECTRLPKILKQEINPGESKNKSKTSDGTEVNNDQFKIREQEGVSTNVDELSSDGSASAFEGTESIDSHEQDMDLNRKKEQLKNDPSGRSNY